MLTKITFLYDALPRLPQDKLRTDLRVLAGKFGLPVSGASEVSETKLTLTCAPFEITIEIFKGSLPAEVFSGSICANIRPSQRTTLSNIVAEHVAYVEATIRHTGHSPGIQPAIGTALPNDLQANRREVIFAQDVARMVNQHMPPMGLLWHATQQLVLPGALSNHDYGRLFLPMCLRLKCCSAALQDTKVVNMAQEVEGAEAFLGKPLQVMALSLNRFETLQLAVAFLDRMLEGESRPIGGAIFRDQRGTRVVVLDEPQSEAFPNGMIALVEVEGKKPAVKTAQLSKKVKESRNQVAARVASRINTRNRSRRLHETQQAKALNEEQMAIVRKSLTPAEAVVPARAPEGSMPPAPKAREG